MNKDLFQTPKTNPACKIDSFKNNKYAAKYLISISHIVSLPLHTPNLRQVKVCPAKWTSNSLKFKFLPDTFRYFYLQHMLPLSQLWAMKHSCKWVYDQDKCNVSFHKSLRSGWEDADTGEKKVNLQIKHGVNKLASVLQTRRNGRDHFVRQVVCSSVCWNAQVISSWI